MISFKFYLLFYSNYVKRTKRRERERERNRQRRRGIDCGFKINGGSPRDVVANVLDSDIVVSEFELQSRHYIHFRTYTHAKGMNLLFPPLWIK